MRRAPDSFREVSLDAIRLQEFLLPKHQKEAVEALLNIWAKVLCKPLPDEKDIDSQHFNHHLEV